ncbi:MAG TPA: ABC transporter substrate-binding protein [Pilimelia sp.]|nr:ABC transporter substrate-binding protein [Pilimelia sp.]
MTPLPRTTTRRRLLFGGSAALGLLLTGCGDDTGASRAAEGGGATPESTGPWEFTDDRGTKISLPRRPQRIVAQVHAAAALWDFGVRPVGVFGPQKGPDGAKDPQLGNVDPGAVTSVGASFGEFHLEQYAALKPDLVVTIMYGSALWYVPTESQSKIESLAPIVGIKLDGVSADKAIERFGALAASLGADLAAPSVTQARSEFDAASERVRQAARDKAGLRVAVTIGQEEGFWVADPAFHGDVKYFQSLGVDVVAPARPNPAFGFEQLSWEKADTYPADLLLEDARALGMTSDQLAAKFPTWKLLPAVKAGQVAPWRAETPSSYQQYAKVLGELADTIAKSRTDVV